MKVGVLIPTRGDRPLFLDNAKRMLDAQSLQPNVVELVNFRPKDDQKDITLRYRMGFQVLKNKCDLVVCWEDDDWYHCGYLEYMVSKWREHGEPDLLGTDRTLYYHLLQRKYETLENMKHSSMMNTCIKSKLQVEWPDDHYPFTDVHIWSRHTGKLVSSGVRSIGIKHGVGLCGGAGHNGLMLTKKDPDLEMLKLLIDTKSYNWYVDNICNGGLEAAGSVPELQGSSTN